jgi:hypothetical protein
MRNFLLLFQDFLSNHNNFIDILRKNFLKNI